MKKAMIAMGLVTSVALMSSVVVAEDDDRRGEYRNDYREHYRERHQMNMDLMKMLMDTMEIVRDLNHKPTADEKKHLDVMVNEMKRMMDRHKEMEKWMDREYRDGGMGMRSRDSDDRDRMHDRMQERRYDNDDR